MGKTIALKLSENENQIITQLNNQGVCNSDLLRSALRQYFESLQNSLSQEQQGKNMSDIHQVAERPQADLLCVMKNEIRALQEQIKHDREQTEKHIKSLESQLVQATHHTFPTKLIIQRHHEIPSNVDQQVDEFLKNRPKQINVFKE
jgi:hypothetical protein